MVTGGRRLEGRLTVQGAKNSVLPLFCAALLTRDESMIEHVPALSDVDASLEILQALGCGVRRQNKTVTVDPRGLNDSGIPRVLTKKMRGSLTFLGALLAKTGKATIGLPGGCPLGQRPVDLHLSVLRQMGAHIRVTEDALICTAPRGLHGARIKLRFPSVGATENAVLAAVTAKGDTVIENAAAEPEIRDLCRYLNACGGRIKNSGSVIRVRGVSTLSGSRFAAMPDRMEAATYLMAAAATGGSLYLQHACPRDLTAVLAVLRQSGCQVGVIRDGIFLQAPERLTAPGKVKTAPHPGFPTDAGAPLSAMAAVANGETEIEETVFENRFSHLAALKAMGAAVRQEGRRAIVRGVDRLHAADVTCTDLRGGAAMVIAALAANGCSVIGAIEHLDRGYTAIEQRFSSLGASIVRVRE